MLKKTQNKLSDSIQSEINSHIEVAKLTLEKISEITEICLVISSSLKANGTIYLCGNGGSAADCQHIAAEWNFGMISRILLEKPSPYGTAGYHGFNML